MFDYTPTEARVVTDWKNKIFRGLYQSFLIGIYDYLPENEVQNARVYYDPVNRTHDIREPEPRRESNKYLYDMSSKMAEAIVDGFEDVMREFRVIGIVPSSGGSPAPTQPAPENIRFGPYGRL